MPSLLPLPPSFHMPLLACRGISPPPLLVQPLNLPLPPSLPFLDSLRLQFLLPPLLSLFSPLPRMVCTHDGKGRGRGSKSSDGRRGWSEWEGRGREGGLQRMMRSEPRKRGYRFCSWHEEMDSPRVSLARVRKKLTCLHINTVSPLRLKQEATNPSHSPSPPHLLRLLFPPPPP